jgi:hypothetical protein
MRLVLAPAVVLACAVTVLRAGAQTGVQLTFSGTASFGAATAADFGAGRLDATSPLPFTVITTSEPVGSLTTTVYIRSSSPTLGSGKPISDMEWRIGDDPVWHALTTMDAVVETHVAAGAPHGHSWSNAIHFRIALRWTGDRPANYFGNLVVTVAATTP